MYFVADGILIISKAVTDDMDEVRARLGPGEVLGEMSLLDGAPRSATARAATRARLFALDRDNFNAFIGASPRLAAAFFRAHGAVAVSRLRASGNLVAEVTGWGLEATGLDVRAVRGRA
jgi:CRP/FNR family transcriptional regulator